MGLQRDTPLFGVVQNLGLIAILTGKWWFTDGFRVPIWQNSYWWWCFPVPPPGNGWWNPCAKTNPHAWWLNPSIQWWKSPVSTSFNHYSETAWFLCSMLKIMRNWWNPNYLLLKITQFCWWNSNFTTEIPGSGWFHWRICRSLTLRRGRNARVQPWGWGSGAPRVRRRHGGVQRLWKRWKLRILQIDTPMELPNGTLGVTIVIINHESDRNIHLPRYPCDSIRLIHQGVDKI